MMVCYRMYVSYDNNPVNACRKLMDGFEGTLHNWIYAKQKDDPNMMNLWESMFLINENGAAILDLQGNTQNNVIGCMLHCILENFVGYTTAEKQIQEMFLSKIKCDDLTNFEFHFTEFLTRLFRLDDPFNPKWKLTFLATLPNWFAKKVTKVFPNDVTKYAQGVIRQGVIGEIVSTCNQMEEYQNRT